MINKDSKQVKLEFGEGDICISGGHFVDGETKIGMIAFSNQPAREIGTEGDIKVGQEYEIDNFSVAMTFTKKESIDVVIEALLIAKKEMD